MVAAERAAAPLMPEMPARDPDAPGMFAFNDPDHVRQVLDESGWSEVDVQPVDLTCVMPEPMLDRYLSLLGPVGRVLQGADEAKRAEVIGTVRSALTPYIHGDEVRFPTASWQFTALNPL